MPSGGERFELLEIRALNYITRPIGSGMNRFARSLSQSLPDAALLGLDRLDSNGTHLSNRLATDGNRKEGIDRARAWIIDEGGASSDALTSLLAALYCGAPLPWSWT